MKHIGKTLYELMEVKGLIKRQVAMQAGISPVYLSSIMHKDDISCGLLEKICTAICVPPSYFFDNNAEVINTPVQNFEELVEKNKEIEKLNQEVNYLKSIIELKNALIDEKERYIRHISKGE